VDANGEVDWSQGVTLLDAFFGEKWMRGVCGEKGGRMKVGVEKPTFQLGAVLGDGSEHSLSADCVEGVGQVYFEDLEWDARVGVNDGVDLDGSVGAGVWDANPTLDGQKGGLEGGHEDVGEDF